MEVMSDDAEYLDTTTDDDLGLLVYHYSELNGGSHPNPWNLWLWSHLEKGPLQI